MAAAVPTLTTKQAKWLFFALFAGGIGLVAIGISTIGLFMLLVGIMGLFIFIPMLEKGEKKQP